MERIRVMVNGLPGKMATAAAESLLGDSRFELLGISQKGNDISDRLVFISGSTSSKRDIYLIFPDEFTEKEQIEKIKRESAPFTIVDYTHPSAVNANAEFYCKYNIPFVMGTTGGNRELLKKTIEESDIPAVIAPNMAKPIIVFQEMMAYAAKTFPNVFKGYSLEIVESHQRGKADTSGTAKAMVDYFNELGIPFSKNQIRMIRTPDLQIIKGVPEEALSGHGWHTYTLKSADGSVLMQFTHNVNGRDVYAAGTIDAIFYLQKKIEEGVKGKVFSMIDVAKGV